jgi:hypothetical protein
MGGIADEYDAALVPVPHWTAIADRAAPPQIHHGDELTHRWMCIPIRLLQLRAMGGDITLLIMGRSSEHRDDVEERAVAERVVHDVEARAAPQHDLLAMHVGGEIRHGHDGAIRHIAGRARLAVADELRADERAQPVGRHERRAGIPALLDACKRASEIDPEVARAFRPARIPREVRGSGGPGFRHAPGTRRSPSAGGPLVQIVYADRRMALGRR